MLSVWSGPKFCHVGMGLRFYAFAKNIDSCQSAEFAQADTDRNFSLSSSFCIQPHCIDIFTKL